MTLKSRILTLLGISGFLAIRAFAITPSWSYESPKVTSGEFKIHNVCMMPTEAKLSKATMKGGQGMSNESDAWTAALEGMVESHFKTAEVEIQQATDVLASGASGDEVHQVVMQLNQKYGDMSNQLNKHPKDIGKSRYTLGDTVSLLPCAVKSDVLVFVQGEGQVASSGKRAMGLLVAGAGTSAATLVLTMADAKTGEIIAYARLSNAENFGDKFVDQTESVYGKALDKQLSRLRVGRYFEEKKH